MSSASSFRHRPLIKRGRRLALRTYRQKFRQWRDVRDELSSGRPRRSASGLALHRWRDVGGGRR